MRIMNNRWICFFVLSMFMVLNCNVVYGHIYEDEYPYKTTVSVKTGEGSVYATYNSVDNYSATPTESTASYTATITSSTNTTSVTLNATAAEGYTFDKWEYSDGSLLTADTHSPTVQLTYDTNKAQYNRVVDDRVQIFILSIPLYHYVYSTVREFSFKACFKEEGAVAARVESGQEAIGSAVVAEESNGKATLVARTINGSEISGWTFDYWSVGDNTERFSEESTIQVPIPDEGKVIYVAHFMRVDTESYCFIRNKSGRYLKLSDTKNFTAPTDENQPAKFNGSFTLVSESDAISDPGCVFIVQGSSNNGGFRKVKLISQSKAVGSEASSVIIQSDISIIPVSNNTYTISTQYRYNNKPLTLYFRDNNGTPDMYNVPSDNSEWELLMLNRDNLPNTYFGAKPNSLLERDDKYYTTLYTTFPYEVQNGTAYYINESSIVPYGEDGKYRVVCHEVPNNKVPENMAVILECDATDAASNKLLPLKIGSVPSLEGTSLLKGQIKVVHGAKSGDGNIFVLSVSPETKTNVGFYKLTRDVAIPDNKAYADLPEEVQAEAKSFIYSFGDDDQGSTNNIKEVALPEDITGQYIYDLQGRRVKNPKQGVYIVNGKKVVIK